MYSYFKREKRVHNFVCILYSSTFWNVMPSLNSCHRRIHKSLPHALELLELSACEEVPKAGLRLMFPHALCPFAFVCKNEVGQNTTISFVF